MQVTTTGLINSALPINEYTLEGGVTIRDKTNGIGKAIFSSELTNLYRRPTYKILINNKQLISPTCSNPSSNLYLIFAGSLKITFKHKNELIKITEVDAKSKTILYVDPKKDVKGTAYDAYFHMPMEISLENAIQKIQNIKTDFTNFKGEVAIYNRHGVAVFGWDNQIQNYALYWANPSEEKVKKIECFSCTRLQDRETYSAKSLDGNVNFRYLHGHPPYLNAELAVEIPLTE